LDSRSLKVITVSFVVIMCAKNISRSFYHMTNSVETQNINLFAMELFIICQQPMNSPGTQSIKIPCTAKWTPWLKTRMPAVPSERRQYSEITSFSRESLFHSLDLPVLESPTISSSPSKNHLCQRKQTVRKHVNAMSELFSNYNVSMCDVHFFKYN
jgi:hypothetical protein